MKSIPRELITSATIYADGIKGSAKIPLSIKHDAYQGPYGLSCPLKAGVQAELVGTLSTDDEWDDDDDDDE